MPHLPPYFSAPELNGSFGIRICIPRKNFKYYRPSDTDFKVVFAVLNLHGKILHIQHSEIEFEGSFVLHFENKYTV